MSKKVKKKNVFKKVLLVFSIISFMLLSVLLILFAWCYHKADLRIDKITASNTGVKLYSSSYLDQDESYSYKLDKTLIDITELPDYTVKAFIAIEDKRFFDHNGYDVKRIAKSMLVNLKSRSKSQGASTITQQLVKNTMLTNEKTYKRKINELMLAIKTEKTFSKTEILNMYLNTIYFGSNAYGIENASQIYFNKSAKELTLNESAILAGLIRNPKKYSPKYNLDTCFQRKNIVLKQMLENNFITIDEYEQAINEKITISNIKNNYENSYYQQAILEACRLLNISEKELIRNNYQIITFMDNNIQNVIKTTYNKLNYDCDKLTIIANNAGEILAYWGESDYDLSNMKRTPASTLKPLAVYLPAIENNIIYPCSPILDEPIDYNGYTPNNAKNEYLGWITAEQALAKSSNAVAVKILNSLTIDKSFDMLKKLGINLDENDKNLSLALGSLTNGISPLKLLESYTVFQNYGKMTTLRLVDKILDKNGKIIYENSSQTTPICDESSSYLTNRMLKTCATTGTASKLGNLDMDLIGKTGTNFVNNKTIDVWNVALSPDISIISWLGQGDNESLKNYSSSFYATALNTEILKQITDDKMQNAKFTQPETIVTEEIDLLEFDLNHKVVLANEKTPERYKKAMLFKQDYSPIAESDFYSSPDLNLTVEFAPYGCEIKFAPKEIYNYKIVKFANNTETTIANITNINDLQTIQDEKVFCYDNISYQLVAEHKYSYEIFKSEKRVVYPKEYLISLVQKQEIFYNTDTKQRWYV